MRSFKEVDGLPVIKPGRKKAKRVGLTVPIGYTERWNKEFAGEAASKEFSSIVVTLLAKDRVEIYRPLIADPKEVRRQRAAEGKAMKKHHFACLAGYGAEAINPYLAFETLIGMHAELPGKLDKKEADKRYIKAIGKGLLKVMAKMGISTYQSYCGAQIFDAVGLSSAFIEKYFTGTATTVEGAGLPEIATETLMRHGAAFGDSPVYRNLLEVGGEYGLRLRGEDHMWTADVIANLQHAVRGNAQDKYRAFAEIVNHQNERLMLLRGLFGFKFAAQPVPDQKSGGYVIKRVQRAD